MNANVDRPSRVNDARWIIAEFRNAFLSKSADAAKQDVNDGEIREAFHGRLREPSNVGMSRRAQLRERQALD